MNDENRSSTILDSIVGFNVVTSHAGDHPFKKRFLVTLDYSNLSHTQVVKTHDFYKKMMKLLDSYVDNESPCITTFINQFTFFLKTNSECVSLLLKLIPLPWMLVLHERANFLRAHIDEHTFGQLLFLNEMSLRAHIVNRTKTLQKLANNANSTNPGNLENGCADLDDLIRVAGIHCVDMVGRTNTNVRFDIQTITTNFAKLQSTFSCIKFEQYVTLLQFPVLSNLKTRYFFGTNMCMALGEMSLTDDAPIIVRLYPRVLPAVQFNCDPNGRTLVGPKIFINDKQELYSVCGNVTLVISKTYYSCDDFIWLFRQ